MTRARRSIAAVAALAALAACSSKTSSTPIAQLSQPSAVAVFRGVTVQRGFDAADPIYPYHPWIAIANTTSDDLTIVDALNDLIVPATVPLHALSYPVPFLPALVVSADLGDRGPDLLVAVSGGDSVLKLVRTWARDGAIVVDPSGPVDLGATVVALLALPPDPLAPGTARLVAALAGGKLAVASYARSGDGVGIHGAGVAISGDLGFQVVDLAALPGDAGCGAAAGSRCVFAATPDPIPPGLLGVAAVDVGTATVAPTFAVKGLDALSSTRAVTAARLVEALDPTVLDSTAFGPGGVPAGPPVERVYALLDERDCGFYAPIPCGLVPLDPNVAGGQAFVPDPTSVTSWQTPFRTPIEYGYPLRAATSAPPAKPPSEAEADAVYAGTYMRIQTALGSRTSTAAAAFSSTDGYVTFVDLSRWEVPSHAPVHATVRAAATPITPPTGTQHLTLIGPDPEHPSSLITENYTDPTALSTAVQVTAGYTPTDRWTVTYQGILPLLAVRRAEVGWDGSLWLAMQATDPVQASTTEVVNLFDPVLGVHPDDIVVFDANVVGTCQAFEASVTALEAPDAARFPGGAVRIAGRTGDDPIASAAWARCMGLLQAVASTQAEPVRNLRATLRAGGFELVRGAGTAARHVGRPELGTRFSVSWVVESGPDAGLNESALAGACRMPPAQPWPGDPASCGVGTPCRDACEDLVRARLARRVSYLSEPAATGPVSAEVGPALGFTLALSEPGTPPRDLQLVISTLDGRTPDRVYPPSTTLVGNGPVVQWDRSPWVPSNGVRFFAPYAGGSLFDATPTISGGNPKIVQ